MADDIGVIKSNVAKMVSMGAPEVDIDAYISGSGTTIDAIKAHSGASNYADKSIGQVASEAVSNIPGSALQFAKDTVQPILHPIDTAESLGMLAKGVAQKTGLVSGEDAIPAADALGKHFADRYGSVDGFKKAIAKDPVGVLADISTVLTLGGSAAARAPGVAGKIGEVVKTAGDIANPINTALKGGELAAKAAGGVANVISGGGVNYASMVKAAEAGGKGLGSAESNAFWANLSKRAPLTDVVDQAKDAIANLHADAGRAYRSGMAQVSKDKTVLSFNDIDAAINNLQNVKNFKGIELSPNTLEVRTQLSNAIGEWKTLDPKEYHTPEGFDALKQKIGDIKDAQDYGTPAWKVASDAYNSVRQTIAKQAPVYDKVMSGYAEAKGELDALSKELSLGKNVNPGTALRKLQSVMRDNVNTSFGYRKELAQKLVDAGAETLPYAVAGQEMSTIVPRGLPGKLMSAGIGLGAGGSAAAHAAGFGAAVSPWALAALPAMSPALMGGASYGVGLGGRVIGRPNLGLGAAEIGRATQP